jgi:tape measure domain-containing protein
MQKSVFQMLLDVKTRGSNNIRRLGRDLQGVQGKAKNLASSFAGLSKPLIALAGIGGGAALLTSIFGTAAELESQTRSLEVLTGSAEKTSQILAEIKAFGAATPFQVRELIDVTKKLKAFGIETDSLVDTTRRLGDVAGATGAELDGIATAFGQIRAKGKFQQEENLQLLERGVDLTTELKEMYGLSGDELAKAMTKGQISFDAANQALIRLTSQGGTYFGGAVAQADTLNGKLSTLQDAFITLGQNIGKVLEPIFKSIIDFLTVLTNQINNLFREAEIANKAREEFGLDTIVGRQKLKRMSVAERRQFFKDIAAREEELRQTDFGMDRLRPDAKTPPLLKQLTGGKVTKEAVQASDKMRQILEQINVARVAGNEFQLAGLEFDREMLRIQEEGLTGNNLAIAQSSALADFDLKRQQLLSGTTEKQKELNKETDKYKITLDQIKDTLANQMTSAIEGLIDGTKSLSESLSGLLKTFASMFLRSGVGSLVSQIFPSAKGNVFARNGIVPYAKGGYIGRPTMALMGESGPEAVLPLRRGRGGRLGVETSGGGVGNVVVNVDASGSSVQGNEPDANQLGRVIGQAVQAELIKQKRPGGLLTR